MPRCSSRKILAAATAALALAVSFLASAGAATAQTAQTVTVDGTSAGRTFDGIGGLSGGASSRLLLDYPAQQRNQILDYLFKPGYGASLQILKAEIGGDTNSTDGPEPSVERSRGQVDCNRGYEWWLMEQAKARNPAIKLSALEWGAPSWLQADNGATDNWDRFWSKDNISYLLDYLKCARSHGLEINYLGGWNESYFVPSWFEELKAALVANGFGDVQVVAADDHQFNDNQNWAVAGAMAADPAFGKAVDVVGIHYPCTWLGDSRTCSDPPNARTAQTLGKPLWASEDDSQQYNNAAAPLARMINRQYVSERITGVVDWPLLSAWYSTFAYPETGVINAGQPWSGSYIVGNSAWVVAQTTQFAQPGWHYLDSAATMLSGGGSTVTLASPDHTDYSTIAETSDASAPQTVTYKISNGLSGAPVHVWDSELNSASPRDYFRQDASVPVHDGSYTVTLQPGHLYTFTTTTGQRKGGAQPSAPQPLPPGTNDQFQTADLSGLSPGFSPVNGAWEIHPCADGHPGNCLQQVLSEQPIGWHYGSSFPWEALTGDPQSWRDYQVSADADLMQSGQAELVGRVDGQNWGTASGYHFTVNTDGQWSLYAETFSASGVNPVDTVLASGTATVGPHQWHQLGMRFTGDQISTALDGATLAFVRDDSHSSGLAGVGVGQTQRAQFAGFTVRPVTAPRSFLPQDTMTATATSQHITWEAQNAVDGSTDTGWESEWAPHAALPQAITINLGRDAAVSGLAYLPPVPQLNYGPQSGSQSDGIITGYNIAVSQDGTHFRQVASGTWAVDTALKTATFSPQQARYIRLEATSGVNGYAAASEINVMTP